MDDYNDEERLDAADATPEQRRLTIALLAVNAKLGMAVSNLAMCIGGGMIQLRSHERGTLGHDDVTENLKNELTTFIDDLIRAIRIEMESIAAENTETVRNNKERISGLAYRESVTALVMKYQPAFTTKLSTRIIKLFAELMCACIENILARTADLWVLSWESRDADAIANEYNELDAITTKILTIQWEGFSESINKVFESASPELDAVADAENKRYTYLLAEGYDDKSAMEKIEKEFKGRVRSILYPPAPEA